MKARATNIKVQCDESGCGWIQDCKFSDIPKWYQKVCPKCGKGQVISDNDMLVYRLVETALNLSNNSDPQGTLPRVSIHINTRLLRSTTADSKTWKKILSKEKSILNDITIEKAELLTGNATTHHD